MNNNIPFMKFRKIAAIASIVLFSLSVLSLSFKGLSLGLDFSGGTLIEVTYEEAVELEEIRNILIENDFDDSQVVNFGSNLDVLIKVADQNGNSSIGESIFNLFSWDFNLTVLAALLAVIGYSLNDTIVVSDRIRENFRSERVLGPQDLIDLSLNQTLGRTIVTSLTTLLVLFALFIFGGELIKGFSLALILGVMVGTYSSIYVVANMLMSLSITQEDLAVPEPEGADFDELP